MAFTYDLTALEIIQKLGCTNPTGAKSLQKMETEKGIRLPAVLFQFLSCAADSPLFSTADIWTDPSCLYTLYDFIEEWLEADAEYFQEFDPEEEESEFYPFFQLPKEQWGTLAENVLQIGSDYGAGVVTFGIRFSDLDQDDPPVYENFENDNISKWSLEEKSVSDFLMHCICDVLCCGEYNTAMDVLKREGWNVRKLSMQDLASLPIDSSAMLKWRSAYGIDAVCGCAYDESENRLLAVKIDQGDPERTSIIEYQK